MKNQQSPTRRTSGFTLIELLVVISIVVVLAALSFAAVNGAMTKTKTTRGKSYATNLASAVEAFYSTENFLPDIGNGPVSTDSAEGVRLLRVLLAQEANTGDVMNSRRTIYLDVKESTGRTDGIFYGTTGGDTVQGMFDPFGNPYFVVLNTEYDRSLQFSMGGQQYILRGENVAVYSAGADRIEGTKDDITTFNRMQ